MYRVLDFFWDNEWALNTAYVVAFLGIMYFAWSLPTKEYAGVMCFTLLLYWQGLLKGGKEHAKRNGEE